MARGIRADTAWISCGFVDDRDIVDGGIHGRVAVVVKDGDEVGCAVEDAPMRSIAIYSGPVSPSACYDESYGEYDEEVRIA